MAWYLAAALALSGCTTYEATCTPEKFTIREVSFARRTEHFGYCNNTYIHTETKEASETFGSMIGKIIDGVIAYFGGSAL